MRYKDIKFFIFCTLLTVLASGCNHSNQIQVKSFELLENKSVCESFDRKKILSKLYEYDTKSRKNGKEFALDEIDAYEYIEGTKNVLLSAPHNTPHFRAGREKRRDILTGAIVRVLQELTDCNAIYTTHKTRFDPNYYDDVPYKHKIKKLLKTKKIIIALDIHGARVDRPFDVDLGTMRGESLLGNFDLLDELVLSMSANNIENLSFNFFPGGSNKEKGQKTVTRFISNNGAPAIQIEINRKLRGKDKEETLKLIKILCEYIEGIEKEKIR
jgi:hypothetical protein